jgi:hypothetical protein
MVAAAVAQKMTASEGPGKTFGMCVNPDIQRIGAFILQIGNPILRILAQQSTYRHATL